MSLELICLVLFLHYVGDFIFQTTWQATNKSKNWKALAAHVSIYTLTLLILGPLYALLNGTLHFLTDAATSRISSKCYQSNNMKGFWITIGADQFIHAVCLIASLPLIGW